MQRNLVLFVVCICLTMVAGTAVAQEDDHGSNFDSMIDSIVQDAFSKFDQKYQTYIFTEEPTDLMDDDTRNWSYDTRHKKWNELNTTALYAINTDSRLNLASSRTYPWEFNNNNFLIHYNRVEALYLGLNYPDKYHWNRHAVSLFGSGGFGFASHRWRYNGGVSQQFGMGNTLIEVGIEGHSLTDTKDQWIVDETENTLDAIIARDDYRDYFSREGVSGWFGLYGKWKHSDMQFRAAYLSDRYGSLPWRTNWSIFGGDKLFRDNPAIKEGRMRSVLASFEMHQEQQRQYYTSGWKVALSAEVAGKTFGGDFGFNRYLADFTRYQPLTRYENLNFRLHAASATGDVPPQKWFELGGISTLPAYMYKEFSGNRVALFNAEYLLNGKAFDEVDFFPSWLLRNCNLMLFYDAGYTNTVSGSEHPEIGFSDITIHSLKTDWGVGIGTRDATIRLGFAWRTDIAEPVHIFLRLSRPF